jgi:hypothetical protein
LTLFDAMEEHLCRTLSHFLVYLGSSLNLSISGEAERATLRASPGSWHATETSTDVSQDWRHNLERTSFEDSDLNFEQTAFQDGKLDLEQTTFQDYDPNFE